MALAHLGRNEDVIHGRLWLGIMVYLADAETADFTEREVPWTPAKATVLCT
jgi:hypothetical protein